MVCRLDRMGDVILSTPCLPALRAALPRAVIYFMVPRNLVSLVDALRCVDAVCSPPDAEAVESRIRKLAQWFEESRIDCVVFLEPNAEAEEAAWRAGVPQRIGFVKQRQNYLTNHLPYRKKKGLKHESLYCFEVLESLGVQAPAQGVLPDPCLPLVEAAGVRCRECLIRAGVPERYGVLHLGAFSGKPRVPVDYFLAVAEVLHAAGCAVVLVGAESDDPDTHEFKATLRARGQAVFDLCGQLDLAELAHCLVGAAVFFARDTGPTHLAAAVGCPTIALFVQPVPAFAGSRRWRPLGPQVQVLEKPLWAYPFESRDSIARRHLRKLPRQVVADCVWATLGSD